MEQLIKLTEDISGIVWGWPMIILLLGTHIFLTFRLKFPQRKIGTAIRLSVKRDKDATGDVSQFGALATSLAATIGTGNIIGVATAVSLGGPGAVLWCWLTGVFGIATKYSEGLLAIKYRVKTANGKMLGGPMYALERGLKMKWLGVLFCIFAAVASFGIGNTVQANAISENLSLVMQEWMQPDTTKMLTGFVLAALVGFVVIGGVKYIMCKLCLSGHGSVTHLPRGILAEGRGWWYSWHGTDGGSSIWYCPRTLLQRIWHGFGTYRGSSSTDEEPCATGIGVIDRHLLGHCHHLCHHRLGHRFEHHRQP